MKTVWYGLVLLAALSNAIVVGIDWHNGAQPDWFVWVSSMFFSVGVAFDSLRSLLESYAPASSEEE